jgi:hypothetical protein
MSLLYKYNGLFKINENELCTAANTMENKNALYAAIYTEFLNANKNPLYSDLTHRERLNKLNEFAKSWLIKRGLN